MRNMFKGPGGRDMKKYMLALVVLWLAYAILSFLAPPAASSARYGLTLSEVNLLRFTIMLPLLFIWATALFSIFRFHNYTKLVQGSEEEGAYHNITLGLWMLL